jgi:hypothetical protein
MASSVKRYTFTPNRRLRKGFKQSTSTIVEQRTRWHCFFKYSAIGNHKTQILWQTLTETSKVNKATKDNRATVVTNPAKASNPAPRADSSRVCGQASKVSKASKVNRASKAAWVVKQVAPTKGIWAANAAIAKQRQNAWMSHPGVLLCNTLPL